VIRVTVEVIDGATPLTIAVEGKSLLDAIAAAKERYLGADVRVVFPIGPEEFFVRDGDTIRPDELKMLARASEEATG
jgi:hypothetical protein